MSDIIVTRQDGGYRGETHRVELLLPSRDIELPGETRVLTPFWYMVLGYLLVYGLIFFYIRHSDFDQVLGSIILVLGVGPLIMFVGRGAARRKYDRAARGPVISRPNQRLVLGAESRRQIYKDDALSQRNIPLQLQGGYLLELRDDDGVDDDRVFNTAALYMAYPDAKDDQLLFENVARDERASVISAVREALRAFV